MKTQTEGQAPTPPKQKECRLRPALISISSEFSQGQSRETQQSVTDAGVRCQLWTYESKRANSLQGGESF